MRKRLITILKFVIFISIGAALMWFAVKGLDFQEIKKSFQEANYSWVYLSVALGVLSHISRAVRWRMLIKPLGFVPKLYNMFGAVMVGYFANLAFPRLGEVTKCGILNRYEKIPIDKLLGTMITERAVDMLTLLIFLGMTLALEFKLLGSFFIENIWQPFMGRITGNLEAILTVSAIILVLIVLLILLLRRLKSTTIYMRIVDLLRGLWDGIRTIRHMKNGWAFVLHSAFIWVLYYLMTYVVFDALVETEHLGLLAALTVFSFGSIGMVAPAPGGIGPYHYIVKKTMVLYDIPEDYGFTFATLLHTSQTIMLILFGFLSLVVLPFINKKYNENNDPGDKQEDH